MTTLSRFTTRASVFVCATLVSSLVLAANEVQVKTRRIHVSAVAKDGSYVKDMTAADFEVKEGGKVQEITVKPAASLLRIAILDSDGGTGAFQAGIANFMQKLVSRAEFSLTSIIVQPDKVLDFTQEVPKLQTAIGAIGQRARSRDRGQLMEALYETAKTIPAEGKRTVILVARIGNENPSTERPENIRNLLKNNGTALYVVSITGADRLPASQRLTNSGGGQEAAQVRDEEIADNARSLQLVLNDGSAETGGRRTEVAAITTIKAFNDIADELLSQYEVTYTLADGVKPNEKLQVTSKRKDVKINAPTKVPTN
jgi:hypothetical protein